MAPSVGAYSAIARASSPAALLVLGNLIGTTMTHELGHPLGLANPSNKSGSYHNNGSLAGRIMNPGGLRSFRERAELVGSGPCRLLRHRLLPISSRILPSRDEGPGRSQLAAAVPGLGGPLPSRSRRAFCAIPDLIVAKPAQLEQFSHALKRLPNAD